AFFFSSRRRHTRFSRDWSSDVCSSDLEEGGRAGPPRRPAPLRAQGGDVAVGHVEPDHARTGVDAGATKAALQQQPAVGVVPLARAEERRVGEEGKPPERRVDRTKRTTS